MPSVASLYFNAVMEHLHPDADLQLNPIVIGFSETHIFKNDEDKEGTTVVSKHAQGSMILSKSYDEMQRQLVLVHIQKTSTEQVGNKQSSEQTQHFNLVVLEDDNAYLFEPDARPDVYKQQIVGMVAAQFPLHKLTVLNCHPQVELGDPLCMAYVCQFADAVLRYLKTSVAVVCAKCFPKGGVDNSIAAYQFAYKMQQEIPGLGPMPAGEHEETWLDKHKGLR